MSKRARRKDSSNSQASLDAGHTPKWTRSSPSASPPPESSSNNQIKNVNEIAGGIRCTLPGHAPLQLSSTVEYEAHYAKEHTNQCVECRANLPSARLLELHHRENHDPLVAAQRERQEKIFKCFLEDCDKLTLTPQKRRLHLIDKHRYPKNYDFRIVDNGFGGRRSLLREETNAGSSQRRRRVSNVGTPGWQNKACNSAASNMPSVTQATETLEETLTTGQASVSKASPVEKPESTEDVQIDSLSTAMSSLSFIPMSVRRNIIKKKS